MITQRATNLEMQKWIARNHGIIVESVWIDRCRQALAQSAPTPDEMQPCEPEQQIAIKRAFRHFGLTA